MEMILFIQKRAGKKGLLLIAFNMSLPDPDSTIYSERRLQLVASARSINLICEDCLEKDGAIGYGPYG